MPKIPYPTAAEMIRLGTCIKCPGDVANKCLGVGVCAYRKLQYKEAKVKYDNMHKRCKTNERYVANKIKICQEWEELEAFYGWFIKQGDPRELCLDRIDNQKGYSPENCRLTTYSVNNNNKNWKPGLSGIVGVHLVGKKYYAVLSQHNEQVKLGPFNCCRCAADARDLYIIEHMLGYNLICCQKPCSC